MSPRFEKVAVIPTGVANSIWWSRTGSNRRRPACKAGALPTELRPQKLVGLYCKELSVLDIYFVRSTETRELTLSSTIDLDH
jgi:hypothetical protein